MSKPTLMSQTQLTTFGAYLPAGATVIGGLVLSSQAKERAARAGKKVNFQLTDCVEVIYGTDNGEIHASTICGSGTSFEITGDHVIGHWM